MICQNRQQVYKRWQAIVLATLSILGSLLASFLVFHLFFKKGGNE